MPSMRDDLNNENTRIDLASAALLAELNPTRSHYRMASERGAFVISVQKGDIFDSVYTHQMEKIFETLKEARLFFEALSKEYPNARYFDFSDQLSAEPTNLSVRRNVVEGYFE